MDPSGYANRFHGITEFTDLVLDAARDASASTGIAVQVVIAANRTRHPLDARTLARLAAQYVGRGVVGFGLSNDERRGTTSEFAPAFRIARNAGLLATPHGGELCGPGDRADLPRRARRRPDRPRRPLGRGPGSAEATGRRAGRAGGLPGVQRLTGRLPPAQRTFHCDSCTRRAPGSRWAPTTRCCSGRGSPSSTRQPAASTASPTPNWPTSPEARSWPPPRRPKYRRPARRDRRLARRRRDRSSPSLRAGTYVANARSARALRCEHDADQDPAA